MRSASPTPRRRSPPPPESRQSGASSSWSASVSDSRTMRSRPVTDSTGRGATAEDRRWLEQEVASRAEHRTAEDVRMTCSFARAERLLGREYHGRFLIELLQNAADAWREDPRTRQSHCRAALLV